MKAMTHTSKMWLNSLATALATGKNSIKSHFKLKNIFIHIEKLLFKAKGSVLMILLANFLLVSEFFSQ